MKSRISNVPGFIHSLRLKNAECVYWVIQPLVLPSPQRGPTCGIVAANHTMKLFRAANPTYSCLPARKSDVKPKAATSLRFLYKQAGISGIGAIYDTEQFELFLNQTDYNAETVSFEDQAEMSQILLNNLMRNKPVIIACDTSGRDEYDKHEDGMGKKIIGINGSGEHPHYVTIVGYYQKKDGCIHYIFSSWEEWLQVSESDLFQSSNSLKMYSGGTDYKLAPGSWENYLPKEITEEDIAELDKFVTPPTDLLKIRNRCILITPKLFDAVAHYSKALSYALRVNYPINIDLVKISIQSGAKIDKRDMESWLIIPKDLTLESIIETAMLINKLMNFIVFKNNWNESSWNEFIQLMKNNTVRLNIKIDDDTLLHRAVLADNHEVIPDLIQYGIDMDVNVPGVKRRTPLHYAVKQDIQTLDCLLKQEKINVNAVDKHLHTPLHDAAFSGRPDIVLSLLEAGADVNAEDKYQNTPLYYAIVNYKAQVVRCFIEHKSACLYRQDHQGESILHVAARYGNISVLSILLTKYMDCLHAKNTSGNTLLHAAAFWGKFDMMKYLITEHQLDVKARNLKGETVLHYYLKNSQNVDNIKWLIEQGADISGIDNRVIFGIQAELSAQDELSRPQLRK